MENFHLRNRITIRSAGVDRYFNNINAIAMMTADEEVEISHRAAEGDEKAINQLVKANLRFVVSVAKQYHDPGIELQDLIQAGNIGMIEAARRFDPTRGFKFISYAVWWIRQRILVEVHNKRIIRLPNHKRSTISKTNKEAEKIRQQLNMDDFTEVEIPRVKLAEVTRYISDPLSKNEDGDTYEDIMAGDFNTAENVEKESLEITVMQMIHNLLNEREAYIISHNYGIGTDAKSLEDIGKQLGLTRERCRQISNTALTKLKKHKTLLRQFLN